MPSLLNKSSNKSQQFGLKIVSLLQKNDFKAFWVGGAVRNLLLKRQSGDIDVATSASPDEVEKLLTNNKIPHKPIGKKFGTIMAINAAGNVEITTFRKEGSYQDRRHPKEVTFVPDFEIDALRRDFTINAIYFDPSKNEIYDPQGGQKDLSRKLIRFVGDPKKRIAEDALRMLRGVRLATQLNFKMESNTFAAIKTRAKYLQSISGERIKSEMDKIMSLENRVDGLRLLEKTGLLQFIMPELYELRQHFHKSRRYHLEGSIFEHALLTLKNTNPDINVGYAALYHDTGKAQTSTPKLKEEGWVNSFPKHELVSADNFLALAKRLKFSRGDRDLIYWMIKMHMMRHSFIKNMALKKKLVLATHKFFFKLIELWKADALSNLKYIGNEVKAAEPLAWKEGKTLMKKIESKRELIDRATDGQMIMKLKNIKSGPRISVIKNKILEAIIQNKIKKLSDVKIFLQKNLKNA